MRASIEITIAREIMLETYSLFIGHTRADGFIIKGSFS